MSFTEYDYDQIADRLFERMQARESNSTPEYTSCQAIADELKVNVRTVIKHCKELGISLKQIGKPYHIATQYVRHVKNSF